MHFARARTGTRLSRLLPLAALAVTLTACQDSVTAPSSHEAHAPSPSGGVFAIIGGFLERYLDTPLGTQPIVTPSMRIESPSASGRVPANESVTIRVRYRNFDNQPDLRTPNAGATLGSLPQVLTDGYVQGHIHGYLQRIPEDGSIPPIDATSFCILTRVVERSGFDGVAEGDCPAVPAGDYRLSAEFQTNSHTAILKDGPRATPTADVLLLRVR